MEEVAASFSSIDVHDGHRLGYGPHRAAERAIFRQANGPRKFAWAPAAAAARTAPKELAAAVASEVKALEKVQAQLATFRVK